MFQTARIFNGKAQRVPFDIELEKAVLGAIFCDPKYALTELLEIGFTKNAFFDKANQLVFQAIMSLYVSDKKIDLITTKAALKKNLEKIGGVTYLTEVSCNILSASHLLEWGRMLLDLQARREAILIAEKLFKEASDCEKNITTAKTVAGEKLFQTVDSAESTGSRFSEALAARLDGFVSKKDSLSGISPGLAALEPYMRGFLPQQLTVVAAATGMGKTALLLKFLLAAVKQKKQVAFFSLEMGKGEIVDRLIMQVSGITTDHLKFGDLGEENWKKIYESTAPLVESNFYVDDGAGLSVADIAARCRRLKYDGGLDLLIIDYLQLLRADLKFASNREQEIAQIVLSLKELSKQLNIPIVTASQLSRSVWNREGKVPQLSDLRESGAIEQTATHVLFIHRPEYYGVRDDGLGNDLTGVAKLIVAKNRNGQTGEASVKFEPTLTRFSDF
jgi:replicative DNA helicase